MNQNQLQQARLARWRQDGNALLTLDDAERWLADTPLCLYLPRQQHLPVPAPTFVEAIAGRPDATPGPETIAAAAQMLARLVASGAVIALNLLGGGPGFVGEQPDFLATPEALPYLYALQPERNPKREPTTVGGARVSPLAAEAYKILEREGALTTIELRSRLGREVTEAAVLRSLAELWHTMRVVPVPSESGEGAHWELLSARHRRELNIGSTQSQTTALSILASFYLQSAVAASEEEIEIFLSPVAARSRIRDVVHGLSTTRQLASFPLNGEGQLHVEGSLPELPEEETIILAAGAIAGEDAGLEQNEPDLTEAAANAPSRTHDRSSAPRRSPRPAFGERARGSFAARDRRAPSQDRPPRREGGFRRPQRSDFNKSGPGTFRRPRRKASEGASAEGTSRPSRPNFERRARPSFGGSARPSSRPDRPSGGDRPARFDRGGTGAPRSGGGFGRASGSPGKPGGGGFQNRRSFGKDRPPRPAGGGFRPQKSFPGKPFSDRPPRSGEEAERPHFRPAAGRAGSPRFGSSRPGSSRPGQGRPDRPFRKPEGDRPAGGPRRFEGRPAAGRPGGPGRAGGFSRPPRRDSESRPFGAGASRRPSSGGESRPQGDRPFKRPYSAGGDRPPRRGPAGSYGKPAGDRGPRKFPPRPRPDAGTSERPEAGKREARPFRPAGERPGRPGGFSKPAGRAGGGKPAFGKRTFGKPSFGKPGGYRKPAGDRPEGDRPARPRPDRPDRPRPDRFRAEGAERPRPPRPAFGSGPRKPGGFRKPGAPGKSFGDSRPGGASSRPGGAGSRPGGAGSRGPRPTGARRGPPAGGGKNRTSTTTSSGQPRRPGGFGKARPGASGRPPAKGGFKPGAKRPGGSGPPKRKPRSEGDEG